MRTDTATFRNRVFKQVRALGINSVRSKIVARRIASGINGGSYSRYGENGFEARKSLETLVLHLNFTFHGPQIVDVVVDGNFAFAASTDSFVLVNLEPTAEQTALRPLLDHAMSDIFTIIADTVHAWDATNGHPSSNELAEVRYKAVNAAPAVVSARADYDMLRDRSLTCNRFAHIAIIDPILYNSYSDDYKDECGSRPRGHIRYDEAIRFYERLDRERAENDNDALSAAA